MIKIFVGLETVRTLVAWNASVIMPVRNMKKGELVKNDIISSLSTSYGSIELMELDLASFDSVRRFATSLQSKKVHIDTLVLNAVLIEAHLIVHKIFKL